MGVVILLTELPANSSAASRFGPVEIVAITAVCDANGGVTGVLGVVNRSSESVSDQVPLILARHIPPSRGGFSHFLPTGVSGLVTVTLGPSDGALLPYGPLSTAGVAAQANALRVEVDTNTRPDLNPERSESFPPCGAQPSPTPPPPTPVPTLGPAPLTPVPTLSPPSPTPTFFDDVIPTVRGPILPPQAGIGPADAGDRRWTPLLFVGMALAVSGATLSLGTQVVQPWYRRTRMTAVRAAEARLPRTGLLAGGQPLVVRVSSIDHFSAFVDTLRTLNGMANVAQARAVLLKHGDGLFHVTLNAAIPRTALLESLSEMLGRAVQIDRI